MMGRADLWGNLNWERLQRICRFYWGSLYTALKTAYNWDWVAFAAIVQALVDLLGPTYHAYNG
jgi:hypothetical protein